MKKFILSLIICLFICNITFSQVSVVKKHISELYFEFNISPSKFDVRKKFHSNDNFTDYNVIDYGDYEAISSDFQKNFKMSYLGRDEKSIVFWFDQNEEKSRSRKVYTEYFPDEYNLCLKQIEELYRIFNKCSYKSLPLTVTNDAEEQTGEGWVFFSSEKSFKEGNYYFEIKYHYYKVKHTIPKVYWRERYNFEAYFTDANLY